MYAATDGKYTLLVLEEEDPLNPREDCEPYGRMVCWHRRYRLGDAHDYAEPIEFLHDMVIMLYKDKPRAVFEYVKHGGAKGVRLEYDRSRRKWLLKELCVYGGDERWHNTATYDPGLKSRRISGNAFYDVVHTLGISDLQALLDRVKGFVLLPLYLYDHSGITRSTSPFSCPWDSGQVGWIYCTPDAISKNFGNLSKENIEKAISILEAEVKCYDRFLCGDCYGFRLYEGGEELDSCWGFLGDLDDIRDDLRANLPPDTYALIEQLEYTAESEGQYLRKHTAA